MYGIYSKFNQVIYTLDKNCKPNSMILIQAVIQIFMSQDKCQSRKRDILQYNIFTEIYTSAPLTRDKLYAKYHDPSLSDYPYS